MNDHLEPLFIPTRCKAQPKTAASRWFGVGRIWAPSVQKGHTATLHPGYFATIQPPSFFRERCVMCVFKFWFGDVTPGTGWKSQLLVNFV